MYTVRVYQNKDVRFKQTVNMLLSD